MSHAVLSAPAAEAALRLLEDGSRKRDVLEAFSTSESSLKRVKRHAFSHGGEIRQPSLGGGQF